ncbi:hypothetical protein Tco_1194497 [Tanacetum coccineum]
MLYCCSLMKVPDSVRSFNKEADDRRQVSTACVQQLGFFMIKAAMKPLEGRWLKIDVDSKVTSGAWSGLSTARFVDVSTASDESRWLILLGLFVYTASFVRCWTTDAFGSRIELFLTILSFSDACSYHISNGLQHLELIVCGDMFKKILSQGEALKIIKGKH